MLAQALATSDGAVGQRSKQRPGCLAVDTEIQLCYAARLNDFVGQPARCPFARMTAEQQEYLLTIALPVSYAECAKTMEPLDCFAGPCPNRNELNTARFGVSAQIISVESYSTSESIRLALQLRADVENRKVQPRSHTALQAIQSTMAAKWNPGESHMQPQLPVAR